MEGNVSFACARRQGLVLTCPALSQCPNMTLKLARSVWTMEMFKIQAYVVYDCCRFKFALPKDQKYAMLLEVISLEVYMLAKSDSVYGLAIPLSQLGPAREMAPYTFH